MTVQGADSINGIRLTEGDFDGCCYYHKPVTLSADSLYGWELTVTHTDSTKNTYHFESPRITFLPSDFGDDLDAFDCTIKPLSELALDKVPVNETRRPVRYDIFGRPTRNANIQIIIEPDGRTRKRIAINN